MITKLKDIGFILTVTAIFSVIANCIGFKGEIASGSLGALVLLVITFVGCVVANLPGFSKLPTVFWVSLVAVIVSIPGFPGSEWIVSQVKHLNLLATTTPILAYAGLCVGKDMEAFKSLSWKIIPVALCVSAGSFICATILAEIILRFEHVF
ncbi:MAG TPA: hypothetical protein DD376_03630 [Sutterella sp.]|nr:hypothetical protein [Sutterella sp.]